MRFGTISKHLTGVAVPVSALRTAASTGTGEFLDLIPFGDFCERAGLAILQVLPVNDTGTQSSPYSAQSAFALHPLYLSLRSMPEAKGFEREIEALASRFEEEPRLRYGALREEKLRVLRRMFRANAAALIADDGIGAWIKKNRWIKAYSVFRLLKERYEEKAWWEWPAFRDGAPETIDAFYGDPDCIEDLRFQAWLQYRLEEQLGRAVAALKAKGVALKGDLPILLNEDSADVWANRKYFRLELRAGAPPDMFSQTGQNWGFPVYDWDALRADGYEFWKDRLAQADRFYGAFRLDHVLGFFRIWAISERNETGYLGRFLPSEPITREELHGHGFDNARIRWMSEPHIRTQAVYDALFGAEDMQAEAAKVIALALDRIGEEELHLFKPAIKGEKDIEALPLHPRAKAFLRQAWLGRVLIEYEADAFAPSWAYWDNACWSSLASTERNLLERLFQDKRTESERTWEKRGREVLGMLSQSTKMLCCAEDLGVVPSCVPRVLQELGILGLRIARWTKRYAEPGEPLVPFHDYPLLSVCTPSVHDTSTLREWWETDAGRFELWSVLGGKGECPSQYSPEVARFLLEAIGGSASALCVFQLQDLLALDRELLAPRPQDERINVPGTMNDFNWSWRMPCAAEALAANSRVSARVRAISDARAARKIKATIEAYKESK